MIKNITSILIALLYLNLSVGVSLNAHICHDEIQSIGILADNENCCDHSESNSCSTKSENNKNSKLITHKNCCNDQEIEIQLDVEQFYSYKRLKIKTPEISFLNNLKSLFEKNTLNENIFSHYRSFCFNEKIADVPFRITNKQFTFYG